VGGGVIVGAIVEALVQKNFLTSLQKSVETCVENSSPLHCCIEKHHGSEAQTSHEIAPKKKERAFQKSIEISAAETSPPATLKHNGSEGRTSREIVF